MTQALSKRGKKVAYKVVLTQFIAVSIVSSIALAMDLKTAASLFIGGAIGVIPAFVFARKLFQYAGARQARLVVRAFYLGEALKLLLTIILFVLVFKFVPIESAALLFGYGVALMAHWVSIAIFKAEIA